MIFSIVFLLFFAVGSVSAIDLSNSSDDSISEHIFQDFMQSKDVPEDILANGTAATALAGNDTELYYKDGTSFRVLLCDVNGTALPDQSVIFNINGNNYTRITNEDGIASIKINLNSGSYGISSYYAGTDVYGASNATNIVNVLSTIKGHDIEKYFKNDTQYYATFVDAKGNLLADTAVNFNINGVYYERKTNEKGTARLNINLPSGNYILTATNPVNGEMSSNNITVLTTLCAYDLVKYYRNDTQYYVTVINGAGKPVINQEVTFNINGVLYTRTTNDKGIARMNINLNPGDYTITSIHPFNGEMHSNNIEVLPTISADDLNMIYRDGSRFTAKVLDDKGNSLANSDVIFNINGIHYTRVTDKDGNAHLNINLDIGKYVITATNAKGLSVSNTINIKKCNSIIKANDAHIIAGIDRDYSVTLIGVNNKTIPLNSIDFRCNGAGISVVTNKGGEAIIVLSGLSVGKYTLEYEFKGNKNYNPYRSSSTLTVENPTNKLTGKDLKMLYKDGSKFKVTLTDLKSVPLVNKTITFTINGNSYDRITDEKGVAGLAINLIPGTYKISYSCSDVDAVDYNKGSNTVTVSKLPAYFSTSDLAFDYGDRRAFIATLTDANNAPLVGIDVVFEFSGSSYTRTTDSSGVAKLNINQPVGYYEIKTSLDNKIYAASTKSNHVLVDGSIFIADDLYTVALLSRSYSVTLLDAYRNPIPNAVVEFTYNGVAKRATTNAQGVATITVNNLPAGDFPIVYNYIKENDAGQSYIHVYDSVLNAKNTISNLNAYSVDSKNCPVSNSEIVALARQLTEGLTNPLDKVWAIFEFVRDIPYGHYYNTKYGAVGTLHNKMGNCVDQSHLSIALYRAAGFPARYVHGTCVFIDGDVDGHVWSQVLVENTWIVSDTINSRNLPGQVNNWNNYNYNLKGYYASLPF